MKKLIVIVETLMSRRTWCLFTVATNFDISVDCDRERMRQDNEKKMLRIVIATIRHKFSTISAKRNLYKHMESDLERI